MARDDKDRSRLSKRYKNHETLLFCSESVNRDPCKADDQTYSSEKFENNLRSLIYLSTTMAVQGAVDISPLKDEGVLKEIITEGTGDSCPPVPSKVTVHYTGTLLDGTVFDSSYDRKEPFVFSLGQGQVIKAWDIGVATMKIGEISMLTCAPKYAYGATGSPPKIPPNATLKFKVELISFTGEDLTLNEDGGIERFVLTPGQRGSHPTSGSVVDVTIVGEYDGKKFEERDVMFSLGEGEDIGIIEGIEMALEKFNSGEKSKLIIKSQYAFKTAGKPEFNIPPNATVQYTVTLKNFEKEALPFALEAPEKIKQAQLYKEKATNYFKADKYKLALKMGQKALDYLNDEDAFESDALKTERDELVTLVTLNLALFYLKSKAYAEAKAECDKVLALDPKNVKALFRRGQAYIGLGSPETAIKDFKAVLEIEPKNAAATQQVSVCGDLIKQNLVKEKKLYANMFDKFAQADRQKEEEELRKQPDVMRGTLGEWGQEERPGGRDATAFEKENPNILMLNANGSDEFKNM